MTPQSPQLTDGETIELRLAADRDRHELHRLADRDTRALPAEPHLVAVRDGRIDAALSLSTGAHVADPFRRTAELVELLRMRAGTLSVPVRPAGRATPTPRPRPRPVTA